MANPKQGTDRDQPYASAVPGDHHPDARPASDPHDRRGADVQPGTGKAGKSWQSRRPAPGDKDDQLEQSLKDSFPASDPPQSAQPGVTGWDLTNAEKKSRKS